MDDGQLKLSADVDLSGRLRGQPAKLPTQFSGGLAKGELSALDVRLGDNRLSGQAALQQQFSGQLQLNLPRLAQLWPGLQGQLSGELRLTGTLQTPQGQLQLQGQRLSYADQQVRQLDLNATFNAQQQTQLSVQAQGLELNQQGLGLR